MSITRTGSKMIKCIDCGKSLPDGYVKCQFCGADVSAIPRPAPILRPWEVPLPRTPSWIKPAYVFMCLLFMLLGGVAMEYAHGNLIALFFGLLDFSLGFGLLLKIDFFCIYAKLICWIEFVRGILGVILSTLLISKYGPLSIILTFASLFEMAATAAFIYVINVADSYERY